MKFTFDERPSDSPFVEGIWRTQSNGGTFTSVAESHWGMVFTKQQGKTYLTVRGPETKAVPAPVPTNAEIFGIVFKLGTFMPHMPARMLVDCGVDLPDASSRAFWMNGAAWEFPTYDNADTFLDRLMRDGLLAQDEIVTAVLQDRLPDMSVRNVRRRFLHATGLTHGAIRQIERARQASALLQQGVSILDTVYEVGYFDQAHMTKSLKHFLGQTPSQLLALNR